MISEFGGPEVLRLEEVAIARPRPGHVLVRVEAVGVNYYDGLVRAGAVSRAIQLPHIVGADVVGAIAALGEGTDGLEVGRRVIVAPGYPTDPAEWNHAPENEAPSYFPTGTFSWGGYAQFIEVPARWVVPDDTGMPAAELATIPLVLVTAVHAVRTLAGVAPGQHVLVQAGASGSGSMAIQVAKAEGAQVMATVSTPEKARLARALGADEVVSYRDTNVAMAAREWTHGAGVDVVLDPVGGTALAGSLASLRPRGVVASFGLAAGAEATIPHLYPFFRHELRILGSWMGSMQELRYGLELVRAGKVRSALARTLPLSAAADAHRLIDRHAVAGKLALLPWAA
jgi:NADPH:quinone reductase-like Zn-dependent oxidoreductase